jgi:hypothetical protein
VDVSRAQPDWEATRVIVQATIVGALRDFVAAAPDDRSMRVEADGHVIVQHGGHTWRWWVDPEATRNIGTFVDSPSYVPWQIEIWVRDDPPHAPGVAERLRNAVSPHSHARGVIRAGEDDPAGRTLAIVRNELRRQTAR